MMTSSGLPREMVVFISYENDRSPEVIAQEMVKALGVGRAEYGVDLITRACEVRVGYDRALFDQIRGWLTSRGIIHDFSFLG